MELALHIANLNDHFICSFIFHLNCVVLCVPFVVMEGVIMVTADISTF